MCSVGGLREFINARLSAAAVEIFTVVEQTIVQYQEEVDAQRRLLDINWNPHSVEAWTAEKTQHTLDKATQHVCKEEHLWNQEKISTLGGEPEPPRIKEELEEPELPRIKEEPEDRQIQVVKVDQENSENSQIKEEDNKPEHREITVNLEAGEHVTDTFMENFIDELSDPNEDNSGYEVFHLRTVSEAHSHQKSGHHVDSASRRHAELKRNRNQDKNDEDNSFMSESVCETDLGEKCLKCGICEKEFKFISQLKKHHRIHTGEKPFCCQTCGKKFRHKHHLKSHMIIHTGEKPCFCDNCGKSFRDRFSLTSHIRTHTGEKPFSCEICGKKFSQHRSLLFHMKTHTNPSL